MPRFAHLFASLLAAVCFAAPATAQQSDARTYNVVVILADDLGYGDVGSYGSEIISTPHIDALAANGVRLTRGYVSHPVCAPSRAALLTGRYQQRFGYEFNPVGRDRTSGVDTSESMIPGLMKQAGYATGIIGKWHLGQSEGYHPLDRGFDRFWGITGGATTFLLDLAPGDDEYNPPGSEGTYSLPTSGPMPENHAERFALMRERSPVVDGRENVAEPAYLTEAFTREAVKFIADHKDERFFLYLAHIAPHTPLQATKKYLDRYRHIDDRGKRIYAAMVSALDDGVGEVMAALEANGIADDTIVVFLSDNGCAGYVQGACTNNPLSGFKGEHLEGGVRVPFIVSWPGVLAKGAVDDRLVSSLDIGATALAAAGLPIPATLDGMDMRLALGAGQKPERTLFWRAGPTIAVVTDRWKLWVAELADAAATVDRAGRPPGETQTAAAPAPLHTMLFDLAADPREGANVASANAPVIAQLKDAFARWQEGMVPPQWPSQRQAVREYDGQKLKVYN